MTSTEKKNTGKKRPVILLGAGGHASVLLEILQAGNLSVLGLAGPAPAEAEGLLSPLTYLGDDESILQYARDDVRLINGIGSVGNSHLRQKVYQQFADAGFTFASLTHPAAILSPSLKHGPGLQVMAGAIIQAEVRLAENVIVNSAALLEHHCHVSAHCHIASAATLCGGVRLGDGVHVGAGATINQGITVGDGAIIASGCVVIRDVAAGTLVAGVPGMEKKHLNT